LTINKVKNIELKEALPYEEEEEVLEEIEVNDQEELRGEGDAQTKLEL
jgi:hypothetical protein